MHLKSFGLTVAILLAGLSVAAAQQKASDPNQQAPANVQGDGPFKSQQGGKEEPGSHSGGAASIEVFVDGKLAVPGAPADSQTVPSKVSERNAKLDKVPIMAAPVVLTDEQKHRIIESVGKGNAPVAQFDAKPADVLPATTQTSELSSDVTADVPMASDLRYIRLKDKILLVRAPNMTVIGEIAVQ